MQEASCLAENHSRIYAYTPTFLHNIISDFMQTIKSAATKEEMPAFEQKPRRNVRQLSRPIVLVLPYLRLRGSDPCDTVAVIRSPLRDLLALPRQLVRAR